MKKTLLLIVIATALLASCRKGVIYKDVIVPSRSEIKFISPTGEAYDGYLVIKGDTNNDDTTDIVINVPHGPLTNRICFLRQIYPNQDIIISSGNISNYKGQLTFDAGGANVLNEKDF